MIEVERLIPVNDNYLSTFHGLRFRDAYPLATTGEPILVTDPTYVADVYNSTDESAMFLRDRGVFLWDFGGDVCCPIWWQSPFLVLPMSSHLPDDLEPPEGVEVLAEDVHTDSGSFVFLPMTDDLPREVSISIEKVLCHNDGVILDVPGGKWEFFYEQFPASHRQLVSLYRNIVVRHEPITSL